MAAGRQDFIAADTRRSTPGFVHRMLPQRLTISNHSEPASDEEVMRPAKERWLALRGFLAERVGSRVLPQGYVYVDELTYTGRQAVRRFVFGLVGISLGAVAVVLLEPDSYREVLAGALIAWSASTMFGAHAAFKRNIESVRRDVERIANRETIHGRLNRIDNALGVRTIDLDVELPHIEEARLERLAHYTNLNEFRPQMAYHHEHVADAYEFWDSVALGRQE